MRQASCGIPAEPGNGARTCSIRIPDFGRFPTANTRSPWFDGRHYVLKGGSCLSEPEVKRASFRNYYTPATRHIVTGVRLAFEIGR